MMDEYLADSLPVADVEKMIHLLGRIAGMDAPIADRRRALLQAICE